MNKTYQYRRRPILKDAPLYHRYPRTFIAVGVTSALGIFYSRFIYEIFRTKTEEEKNGSSAKK